MVIQRYGVLFNVVDNSEAFGALIHLCSLVVGRTMSIMSEDPSKICRKYYLVLQSTRVLL